MPSYAAEKTVGEDCLSNSSTASASFRHRNPFALATSVSLTKLLLKALNCDKASATSYLKNVLQAGASIAD
eukprot:Skav217358  [mRNA]  locus=scaffold4442:87409:88229:- [translate_table: standard]